MEVGKFHEFPRLLAIDLTLAWYLRNLGRETQARKQRLTPFEVRASLGSGPLLVHLHDHAHFSCDIGDQQRLGGIGNRAPGVGNLLG